MNKFHIPKQMEVRIFEDGLPLWKGRGNKEKVKTDFLDFLEDKE